MYSILASAASLLAIAVPILASTIHPNGNRDYCLDVQGARYENGTPVTNFPCNGSPAQKWTIQDGSTKVSINGGTFCLDAGSMLYFDPANGVGLKIWQCYDNLPAQAWYLTKDKRIALEGKGLCVDLPNGVLGNGTQVQIWTCTDFNFNQVWVPSD